jgi:hypothetical protein
MSITVRTLVFGSFALLAGGLFLMAEPAQIQNPLKAARDAVNKARQEQQQQQQQQKQQQEQQQQQRQQQTPPQTPQSGAGQSSATAAPGSAEPWTPPVDNFSAQAVQLDPSKMPDVVGVHLGMTAQQALEAMHKQYPKDIYEKLAADWWPAAEKPDYGFTILSSAPGNEADAHLSFTAPPNPQLVWRITRFTYRMHINHGTLLTALREKYGKETVAYQESNYTHAVTDDRAMADLYWLFDESGRRIPLPPATAFPQTGNIMECVGTGTAATNPQPVMPTDDADFMKTKFRGWCGSFVGVHMYISSQEIVENTFTEMLDVPLAARTAHAAAVWQRDLAEKLRKEDLERSKNVKPVF